MPEVFSDIKLPSNVGIKVLGAGTNTETQPYIGTSFNPNARARDNSSVHDTQKVLGAVTSLQTKLDQAVSDGKFTKQTDLKGNTIYTLKEGDEWATNVKNLQVTINVDKSGFSQQGTYATSFNGVKTFSSQVSSTARETAKRSTTEAIVDSATDLKNLVDDIGFFAKSSDAKKFENAVPALLKAKGGLSYEVIKNAAEAEKPLDVNSNTKLFNSEQQRKSVDFVATMFKTDPLLDKVSKELKTPLVLGIDTTKEKQTATNYHLRSGTNDSKKDLSLIIFNNTTSIDPSGELYASNPKGGANVATITNSTVYNELSEINAHQYAATNKTTDYTGSKEIQELNKGITDVMRSMEQNYIKEQVVDKRRALSDITSKEIVTHLKTEIAATSPKQMAEYLTAFYKGSDGYPNPAIDPKAPIATQLSEATKVADFYNKAFIEGFYAKGYPELSKVQAVAQKTADGKGVELVFKVKQFRF